MYHTPLHEKKKWCVFFLTAMLMPPSAFIPPAVCCKPSRRVSPAPPSLRPPPGDAAIPSAPDVSVSNPCRPSRCTCCCSAFIKSAGFPTGPSPTCNSGPAAAVAPSEAATGADTRGRTVTTSNDCSCGARVFKVRPMWIEGVCGVGQACEKGRRGDETLKATAAPSWPR